MRPLTLDKPKPMIEVMGKPILHHIFDILPVEIDEVVLVVGYKGDKIRNYFGNEFQKRKIKYIEQKDKKGTAHALLLCGSHLKNEKFLLLYADDFHGKESIEKCVKHELAVLVAEAENPERFGVVTTDSKGRVIAIEEKPEKPKSNLVSTGFLVLDQRIFNYEPEIHPNGEYYLTDMLNKLIRDHQVIAEKTEFWVPIGYPEDLIKIEKVLKSK